MLADPSPLALFGIKNALRPFKNYYVSLLIFILFFFGANIVDILLVLPHTHIALAILFIVTAGTSLFFFVMAMCTNPGYLSNDGSTILELLEKHDPASVCYD